MNLSFFPSWDKGYYTAVYDVTRSGQENYRHFIIADRSQLFVSLHSKIQLKPEEPSTAQHLGARLLFR